MPTDDGLTPDEPVADATGRRLSRREIHDGRIVRLSVDRVRLPDGRDRELELIRHVGAAAVVPLLDDGDVLLVHQYRYATGGWLDEVPAGTLEPGESPEQCARREVEEEVGHRPSALESLGWIWTTPGFTDERIWLYLARGLAPTRQNLDGDELIEVVRLPLVEAVERAARGEMHDGKSVCALLRAAHAVGRVTQPSP